MNSSKNKQPSQPPQQSHPIQGPVSRGPIGPPINKGPVVAPGNSSPTKLSKEAAAVFSEKEIRDAFDNVDVDRTGKIKIEEMVVMLRKIGVKLPDDMIEGFARSMNKDKDSTISYDEFKQWWNGVGSERIKGMMKEYIKAKKEKIRKVFEELDEDKSGSIELDEVPKIAARMKMKISPEELKRQFLASDLDGDRRISFEEFYHWWKSQQAYMMKVKNGQIPPPKQQPAKGKAMEKGPSGYGAKDTKDNKSGYYGSPSGQGQQNSWEPAQRSGNNGAPQGSYGQSPSGYGHQGGYGGPQGGYGSQVGHGSQGGYGGNSGGHPGVGSYGYGAQGGQMSLEEFLEKEIGPFLLPALKQIGMQR